MELLDGKALSIKIKQNLKKESAEFEQKNGRKPHLAAVLVGDNPASHTYVRNKITSCEEAGFQSSLLKFDADLTEEALLKEVEKLNNDPGIDGFIVQLPLPKHIDVDKVTNAIDYRKDVDGFHPVNLGRMVSGLPSFVPATPFGIMKLLEEYKIETSGKHVVVIGRSNIVGTPISVLLSRNSNPGNATVTLCHSRTKDLKNFTKQADIIVAAVGVKDILTADMVREGVVVIDVGMNQKEDPTRKSGYRLCGDVDFEGLSEKASYMTPVPGGVGPMTIAGLLINTLRAATKEVYK